MEGAADTQTTGSQPAAGRQPTGSHPAVGHRVRIHVGELVSAGSALGLGIVFFAMAWYGVAGVADPTAAKPSLSGVQTGWNALANIRWVVLLTIAAALGSVVLHATQRTHGARTDTSRIVLVLGLVTTLLLVWRVLIEFPSPAEVIDQKLGGLLGVLFAGGIAYGGHESLIELRDRRRLDRTRHRTASHPIVLRPASMDEAKGVETPAPTPPPPASPTETEQP